MVFFFFYSREGCGKYNAPVASYGRKRCVCARVPICVYVYGYLGYHLFGNIV